MSNYDKATLWEIRKGRDGHKRGSGGGRGYNRGNCGGEQGYKRKKKCGSSMEYLNCSIKKLTQKLSDDTENDQESSNDEDDSSGGNRNNCSLTWQPAKANKGKERK